MKSSLLSFSLLLSAAGLFLLSVLSVFLRLWATHFEIPYLFFIFPFLSHPAWSSWVQGSIWENTSGEAFVVFFAYHLSMAALGCRGSGRERGGLVAGGRVEHYTTFLSLWGYAKRTSSRGLAGGGGCRVAHTRVYICRCVLGHM